MRISLLCVMLFVFMISFARADSCCGTAPQAAAFSEQSVYQLESEWKDQAGREIRLGDLRGRVRIVSMIFTHCLYACPIISADLKAIDAELSESQRAGVEYVLFSLDAERDTPELLADFAQRNGLNGSRWQLLVSDAGSIRELASVFGVRYRKEADGNIAHSNVILVLNKQGEIIHRQEGLQPDPAATAQAIFQKLTRENR